MRKDHACGIELVDDRHFSMKDPRGRDLIRWKRLKGFLKAGLVNTDGWAAIHVVHWRTGESGERIYLYDQMMLVLAPSVFVVCETQHGRIGVVEVFRMTNSRSWPETGSDYLKHLEQGNLWEKMVGSLGQMRWQIPRGMCRIKPGENLEQAVLRSAIEEAEQEGGFRVVKATYVGDMNADDAFFVHPQFVVHLLVETQTDEQRPDLFEEIGRTRFVSPEELQQMYADGLCNDGPSMASLLVCGINAFPHISTLSTGP
ncbi:MAG: NUDIX domain-containing protein [Patescibacteria group bacterium]